MLNSDIMKQYPVVNIGDGILHYVYGDHALHNLAPHQFYRTSHVFIELPKRYFVLKRSCITPNKWEAAVSCNVLVGEGYKDAALRAVKNSLGLNIIQEDLWEIDKICPDKTGRKAFITLFAYLLSDNEEFKIDNKSVKELVIRKLSDITNDVQNNPDNYSEEFMASFALFKSFY